MKRQGIAPVRVRVVDPPERDKQRLREGLPAAERPRLSDRDLRRFREKLERAGLR